MCVLYGKHIYKMYIYEDNVFPYIEPIFDIRNLVYSNLGHGTFNCLLL